MIISMRDYDHWPLHHSDDVIKKRGHYIEPSSAVEWKMTVNYENLPKYKANAKVGVNALKLKLKYIN